MIKRRYKRAGIRAKTKTADSLRRACIMNLVERGLSPHEVAKAARQSQTQVMMYFRNSPSKGPVWDKVDFNPE